MSDGLVLVGEGLSSMGRLRGMRQLSSLRWIESLLGVMTEAGFSEENAAAAYRTFSSVLLGYLLLEVSARGVETGPVEEPDVSRIDDLSNYPILQRLGPHLSLDVAAQDCGEALAASWSGSPCFCRADTDPPRLTQDK